MNLPEDIVEALARAASRLGPFGRQIRWYPEVTSTSDVAAAWAEQGAPEGAVVIADAQTAGRGRHGRSWESPPAAGLYFSTVVKPTDAALPLLTIAAGVAVAEGIEAATALATTLKWPNDVYVRGRKLAGLLAESAAPDLHEKPRTRSVILGIGINMMPASYPPEVAARATSLEGELSRPVDRGLLLAETVAALASRYGTLQKGNTQDILDSWRGRGSAMLGRQVTWVTEGTLRRGVAEDIDGTGALLVRTGTGLERIISGEVTWNLEA